MTLCVGRSLCVCSVHLRHFVDAFGFNVFRRLRMMYLLQMHLHTNWYFHFILPMDSIFSWLFAAAATFCTFCLRSSSSNSIHSVCMIISLLVYLFSFRFRIPLPFWSIMSLGILWKFSHWLNWIYECECWELSDAIHPFLRISESFMLVWLVETMIER